MDNRPGELDDRSVLAAARAAVRAEKQAGCELLMMAAAWADLHPSESLLSPQERLEWYGERAILYGGEGTPDVAETAAGTLGAEIGMNPDQARRLIADSLTRLAPGQRLNNLLDAQIKHADQDRLEAVAADAVHDRYVRQGRPDEEGMADIWFRTTAADATSSMASINQLANLLITRQDDLPAGVAVRGAKTKDEWRGSPRIC